MRIEKLTRLKIKSNLIGNNIFLGNIEQSPDKKREYSTPNVKLQNNLAKGNQIAQDLTNKKGEKLYDNFEDAFKQKEIKADPVIGHPQYIQPIYPMQAQFQPFTYQIPYQAPLGIAQQFYQPLYPGYQQVPVSQGVIPNQLPVGGMSPQPIYIFYPTPKPPLNDHEIKDNDESLREKNADVKIVDSNKPKIEFHNTMHNQISKLEEEDVPMDIGDSSSQLNKAPSAKLLDERSTEPWN